MDFCRGKGLLFSLIMLTTLDGKPVWVESSQVQIVRHSLDCAHGQATAVRIGGAAICVKETIDEIREKVKKGNIEDYHPPF